MQDRALAHPKINFRWEAAIKEIRGTDAVEGVVLENLRTQEETDLPVQGVFVAIGYTPNTEIFRDQVEMNEKGYIIRREHSRTNVPGVFVAGDVEDFRYRQAVTAAGDGCRAALDAEAFLEGL